MPFGYKSLDICILSRLARLNIEQGDLLFYCLTFSTFD